MQENTDMERLPRHSMSNARFILCPTLLVENSRSSRSQRVMHLHVDMAQFARGTLLVCPLLRVISACTLGGVGERAFLCGVCMFSPCPLLSHKTNISAAKNLSAAQCCAGDCLHSQRTAGLTQYARTVDQMDLRA